MSVLLTGTGSLFARLGRVGHFAQNCRINQVTLNTDLGTLMAQYASTRYSDVDGIPTQVINSQSSVAQIMAALSQVAQNTLLGMVRDDKPDVGGDISTALAEVIKQMLVSSDSVKACTVTASAAAFSTPVANAGNGTMVVSTKRGDGLVQENLFAEVAYVTCVTDSQTGGSTVGQETFTYNGVPSVDDVWSQNYPGGSGVSTSLTAIDASTYQSTSGNLLNNGDMETFTTNVPNQWAVLAGTAGTDFQKSTATVFDGSASLQFIGGTSSTESLAQTFNNSGGTTATLQPDTAYAVNFWLKADVVPAAGVVTIDLVDGSNTVINDDQGVANSFTTSRAAWTTGWVAYNGVFRTPRSLPSSQKLRVRVSTAISGGSNVFLDRLAMTPMTLLYSGGPLGAIFSGQTTSKFIAGDGFTLTTTNNYGGASNLSTFQQLFERLFGLRALGLVLPSSGSPTVADSLISS